MAGRGALVAVVGENGTGKSTMLSLLLGSLVGLSYNGTVLPLVAGFAVLGTIALFLFRRTIRSGET